MKIEELYYELEISQNEGKEKNISFEANIYGSSQTGVKAEQS